MQQRWCRVLPGLWAGLLLCIAFVAAPAVFATLPTPDAGRVVSRIFAQEAWISLALAATLLMLERACARSLDASRCNSRFTHPMLLWGTIVCTLLGYFAVQQLMPAARAGQGAFSFGQLHLISTAFYGMKTLLVLVLAWRATRAIGVVSPPPSS